jgi:hypothetical protein
MKPTQYDFAGWGNLANLGLAPDYVAPKRTRKLRINIKEKELKDEMRSGMRTAKIGAGETLNKVGILAGRAASSAGAFFRRRTSEEKR